MQAIAASNPRSNKFSWLGALPVALIVGLSIAACTANTPGVTTTSNGTEPNACRVNTCSSLGKNCGIIADGCGNELRCGTCAGANNNCVNNLCQRACQSNTECPSGSSCINGSCTDKCSTASDCPSGQTCSNGSCVANAAQYCRYDSDCRADERCQNNYCASTNATSNQACAYDSQCPSGERCNAGLCSNVGGQTCRVNTDCPVNQSCTNGYCYVTNGNAGSCRTNYDCPNGGSCSYGVCTGGYYEPGNNGGYNGGGYNGGGYNGGVRSQCLTSGVSLPLPFGNVNIAIENYYYDSYSPNGERVDSCTCGTGVMHISDSSGNRDVGCSRCIKDGDTRTCYY